MIMLIISISLIITIILITLIVLIILYLLESEKHQLLTNWQFEIKECKRI